MGHGFLRKSKISRETSPRQTSPQIGPQSVQSVAVQMQTMVIVQLRQQGASAFKQGMRAQKENRRETITHPLYR